MLHRADESQPARNSCPRLPHFVDSRFGLYHVAVVLSFLRSPALQKFESFKLRNLFSVKDSNACYIGKTGRHFPTRVHEHLSYDKSSHIFKHLQSSECCCQSCSADYFEILDSAPTKFQLKLKEAMHINWETPNLNQQVHHVNLTLIL